MNVCTSNQFCYGLGVWVGRGEVGARVVAISTSGMPFARAHLRTMIVDYGVLSLALTTLLALRCPLCTFICAPLSPPYRGWGIQRHSMRWSTGLNRKQAQSTANLTFGRTSNGVIRYERAIWGNWV